MTNVQIKLKEIRKNRGYTQKEVASFLGISQQAYQKLEAGRTEDMRISTLRKLCFLLDVSADYLLDIKLGIEGNPYVIIKEDKNGNRNYKIDWNAIANRYKEEEDNKINITSTNSAAISNGDDK